MFNFVKDILKSINLIDNWRQVLVIFFFVFLIFVSIAPERFWDNTESLIQSMISNKPIKITNTKAELLIKDFDGDFDTATGVGVFDEEKDVLITYLNPLRFYTWQQLNLYKAKTISITQHSLINQLAFKKCIYTLDDSEELLVSSYHLSVCQLLANTGIVFAFKRTNPYTLAQDREYIVNVVTPNLSKLANKIDRINYSLDN